MTADDVYKEEHAEDSKTNQDRTSVAKGQYCSAKHQINTPAKRDRFPGVFKPERLEQTDRKKEEEEQDVPRFDRPPIGAKQC
jgi:hypothetical protein